MQDHAKADQDALALLDAESLGSPSRQSQPTGSKQSSTKKSPPILDDEDDDMEDDERTARRLARGKRAFAQTPTRPSKKPKLTQDRSGSISSEGENGEDDLDMEPSGTRIATRNRPAPPPGYVSLSIGISNEEIDALIAKGAAYASISATSKAAAQGTPIIDDEGTDTGLSGDVEDDSSSSINLVTGDVTKPGGPAGRPKLIIMFVPCWSIFCFLFAQVLRFCQQLG